jgi:hypothetical protein
MTHILLIKIFTLSSQVKARHDWKLLLQCIIPPSPFVQGEGCFSADAGIQSYRCLQAPLP